MNFDIRTGGVSAQIEHIQLQKSVSLVPKRHISFVP